MNKVKHLLYAIFLDKEDNLDLSQFFLVWLNVLFITWVVKVSTMQWVMNEPILDAFLVVYGTTVILASPSWLVKLWIEKKDWFRRSLPAPVVIPPPPEPPIEEEVLIPASTDISEMNRIGTMPAVAPTEFPPKNSAPDNSPTSIKMIG